MLEKFIIALILSALICHKVCSLCEDGPCSTGQYLNDADETCHPCPSGQYMDKENHQCRNCFPCKKADGSREVILKPCTDFADAEIGCTKGYFYEKDSDVREKGYCEECSTCGDKCELVPCGNHEDVQCCPCRRNRNQPELFECVDLQTDQPSLRKETVLMVNQDDQLPDIVYRLRYLVTILSFPLCCILCIIFYSVFGSSCRRGQYCYIK
ncbi:unnamed protein product [Lymnaea stagnalis]|uniref:TNFR-Cys domain-containing protein n=1 Tax=Lymnaea stagnalis TaxID=6523 RepID=A0AAV2I1Y7_LYMST